MADLTLRQCELVCKLVNEEGKPYITVEQVVEVVQKRKCIESPPSAVPGGAARP